MIVYAPAGTQSFRYQCLLTCYMVAASLDYITVGCAFVKKHIQVHTCHMLTLASVSCSNANMRLLLHPYSVSQSHTPFRFLLHYAVATYFIFPAQQSDT